MKWLVVLDPIDGLISRTDTSLAVIRRAREKGIEVDTATIDRLYFEGQAQVLATGADDRDRPQLLGDYDLVFMRKEPPYDMAFHYATQLLSLGDTLVLNSPSALRDFNEKLMVLPFVKYMPPTLVAADLSVISDFINRHGSVVVKSLDSFQGKSVQLLDDNDSELLHSFTSGGSRPIMVQKFLDQVYEGDKRVISLGHQVLRRLAYLGRHLRVAAVALLAPGADVLVIAGLQLLAVADVPRLERVAQRLHRVRERLVGEIAVGEHRVAAGVGHVDGVE